jgi:hypothetical protein
MKKASGDVVRIADTPRLADAVCINSPVASPRADQIPAILPCTILLDATYSIDGPGTKVIAIAAVAKIINVSSVGI